MSDVAVPVSFEIGYSESVSEHVCPPCLRRLAPASITLTSSGGGIPIDGRKVHLVSGSSFTVEVRAQSATSKVEIRAESPLFETVSTTLVQHGNDFTYHSEFSAGKTHFRILPLPKSTVLHVTVADGLNDPLHLAIPVKVWPAVSSYGLSAVIAFLGIVGLRLERIFAHENSFEEIVDKIVTDLPRLGLIGASCLLIPPIAWLVGRIIGLADLWDAE